jgi:transketolase
LLLAPGVASAQSPKPTDPQIAHIAYTAGQLDIAAAHLALQKSKNKDVVAFANGQMVSAALAAAEALAEEEISLRVVNVSSMKPVDEAALVSLTEGMKGIVTVEEHSLIGGLGSLIAEVMRGRNVPQKSIGIADRFGQSAHNYEDLLEAYGLTPAHVAAAVRQLAR